MQQCMGCMEQMEDGLMVCPNCGYEKGTPPREAYHMPPESILASRYIVGRVLGFGGFGVTYIGWDAQLERKVAIKEFLPSSFATRMPGYTEITVYGGEATLQFEAGLTRFTDEARRLAGFNSVPGIVDIYDTFVENNTAYIVMQFLQGRDVKAILAEKGSFSFEEALPIIVEICNTLEPVHKAEIIHRDIAPDNIYITKDREIKLLDFGASRFATSVNSKSLSVILKSGYAPEEQYRSRGDQGSWSDVYALAATFYKMLTGVTPEDSMERAIKDELKEPSQLGAVLPKDAENAIMNAMNIRRENRIQTVEEFKKAITGDKVNRVKEKAVKSDSGSLPLWGKLLIVGALVFTLGFGLLTVTGVVDFGQGNLLADTFGSGIPEGYVNAPGVVNQMEKQAQKSAKKSGLTYLIVGTEYSDDIEKGRVLSQEPLPGRLIEDGGELQVNISGGSREEAMASGEMKLPDLTYMTVEEAAYQINQAGYRGSNLRYEYSDTIAEGLVISYEEGYVTRLVISAGKDDGDQNAGQMRAPALYTNSEGVTMLSVVMASARESDHAQGAQERIYHKLYYSIDDGSNWYLIEDNNDLDNYYKSEWRPVPVWEVYLEDQIRHKYPHLIGEEVRFKLERYWEKDYQNGGYNGEEIPVIDRVEFTQRLLPEAGNAVPEITKVQKMTWEEIGKLLKKEKDYQYSRVAYRYQDLMEQEEENREEQINREIPFLIEGNFKEGTDYIISARKYDIFQYPYVEQCSKDGTLLFSNWFDSSMTKKEISILVSEVEETTVSENGEIGIKIAPAGEYRLKGDQVLGQVKGERIETVLSELANGNCDLYLTPYFTFTQNGEEAEVVSYIADQYDPLLTISLGSREETGNRIRTPIIMPNSTSGIRAWAGLNPHLQPGERVQLALYASTGGSTVEIGRQFLDYENQYNLYNPNNNTMILTTEFYAGITELKESSQNSGAPITFQFQLENEEGAVLEIRKLSQTVTIQEISRTTDVSSIRQLQFDEVAALVQEGMITENNNRIFNEYQNRISFPNYNSDNRYFMMQGGFQAGRYYNIGYEYEEGGSSSENTILCEQDGILYLTMSGYFYDSFEQFSRIMIGLQENIIDENGSFTITVSPEQEIKALF